MKSQSFCRILILITYSVVKVNSLPELVITDDGPSILDSKITFSAVLRNFGRKQDLIFVFNDGVRETQQTTNSFEVTEIRSFPSSSYTDGFHFMNITVLENFIFFNKTVVANYSKFDLTRDLIGNIYVYRDSGNQSLDVDEIAVGENVSITVDIVDKSNYLQNAIIDYSWSIDFEKHQTLNDTLIYNFHYPGIKDIKAVVTAVFLNNVFKYGAFERTIIAKVPVDNLNFTGNPFLYHGDKLKLNISCTGTPPFVYCYEIWRSNVTRETFNCSHFSTFSSCHMEIIKYIQNDGNYQLGIYVSNNVREVKRVIEVIVYSVSVNPTLSTIIIPIVCSLLTLVIIIFGISYCIQHRGQMAVEVANFDFQDESDSYVERTFFENIFDSFTCTSCVCRHESYDGCREEEPMIREDV